MTVKIASPEHGLPQLQPLLKMFVLNAILELGQRPVELHQLKHATTVLPELIHLIPDLTPALVANNVIRGRIPRTPVPLRKPHA